MKKVLLFALMAASSAIFAQNQTVTFTVGIPSTTTGITGVDVTGNWVTAAGLGADWSDALVLTETVAGSRVYTGTASLPAGSYEAKFRTQGASTNWEGVPGACATNGNRAFTVAAAPAAVGPYCFGTCDVTCPNYVPLVVNFKLNTAATSQSLTVPAGSVTSGGATINQIMNFTGNIGSDSGFPDWSPGSIAMTDAGSGLFTKTLNLLNKSYEFKFLFADQWNAPDPNDPTITNQFSEQGPDYANGDFSCLNNPTPTDQTNRTLNLTSFTTSGATVDVNFDWESCSYTVGVQNVANEEGVAVSPNPFNGQTVITFHNDSNEMFNFTLTNMTGQVVKQFNNFNGNMITLNNDNLASGVYFASIRFESGKVATVKVIAQ